MLPTASLPFPHALVERAPVTVLPPSSLLRSTTVELREKAPIHL
jgi:hypothetical protein